MVIHSRRLTQLFFCDFVISCTALCAVSDQ